MAWIRVTLVEEKISRYYHSPCEHIDGIVQAHERLPPPRYRHQLPRRRTDFRRHLVVLVPVDTESE